jgi:hypothetical protein
MIKAAAIGRRGIHHAVRHRQILHVFERCTLEREQDFKGCELLSAGVPQPFRPAIPSERNHT